MSLLKLLLPAFVQRPILNLQKRLDKVELAVRRLEMTLDALVVSPKYKAADEIGFNRQAGRKRLFAELISTIPFDALVETGTWLGDTTGFMAETAHRQVYSCELDPRFHALAGMRLADIEGIHLTLSDTRSFLKGLLTGPLIEQTVFFYLDAHWYEDLPLQEEVEIIATNWKQFVVMIDDFEVPGDPGYGFDDYGPGKRLDIGLLEEAIRKHALSAYFPAMPSQEETGTPRGCVVLAPNGNLSQKLLNVRSIRPWHG